MTRDYMTIKEFCILFGITIEEYYKLKDDKIQMKKLYRKIIKACHPDANINEKDEETAKKINAAYAAYESDKIVEEDYSEFEDAQQDCYEEYNDYTRSNQHYEYKSSDEEWSNVYQSEKTMFDRMVSIFLNLLRVITFPIRGILYLIVYLFFLLLGLYTAILGLGAAAGFVYCIGTVIYMIGAQVTDILSYLTYLGLISVSYAAVFLFLKISEWCNDDAADWLKTILFYWEVA